MRTIYVGLFALLSVYSVNAQQTTSAEKVRFYDSCMPSCQSNQRSLPENAMLADIPFVLDAYCSCYCARVSLRLTPKQILAMTRAGVEGKKSPRIAQ